MLVALVLIPQGIPRFLASSPADAASALGLSQGALVAALGLLGAFCTLGLASASGAAWGVLSSAFSLRSDDQYDSDASDAAGSEQHLQQRNSSKKKADDAVSSDRVRAASAARLREQAHAEALSESKGDFLLPRKKSQLPFESITGILHLLDTEPPRLLAGPPGGGGGRRAGGPSSSSSRRAMRAEPPAPLTPRGQAAAAAAEEAASYRCFALDLMAAGRGLSRDLLQQQGQQQKQVQQQAVDVALAQERVHSEAALAEAERRAALRLRTLYSELDGAARLRDAAAAAALKRREMELGEAQMHLERQMEHGAQQEKQLAAAREQLSLATGDLVEARQAHACKAAHAQSLLKELAAVRRELSACSAALDFSRLQAAASERWRAATEAAAERKQLDSNEALAASVSTAQALQRDQQQEQLLQEEVKRLGCTLSDREEELQVSRELAADLANELQAAKSSAAAEKAAAAGAAAASELLVKQEQQARAKEEIHRMRMETRQFCDEMYRREHELQQQSAAAAAQAEAVRSAQLAWLEAQQVASQTQRRQLLEAAAGERWRAAAAFAQAHGRITQLNGDLLHAMERYAEAERKAAQQHLDRESQVLNVLEAHVSFLRAEVESVRQERSRAAVELAAAQQLHATAVEEAEARIALEQRARDALRGEFAAETRLRDERQQELQAAEARLRQRLDRAESEAFFASKRLEDAQARAFAAEELQRRSEDRCGELERELSQLRMRLDVASFDSAAQLREQVEAAVAVAHQGAAEAAQGVAEAAERAAAEQVAATVAAVEAELREAKEKALAAEREKREASVALQEAVALADRLAKILKAEEAEKAAVYRRLRRMRKGRQERPTGTGFGG